MKGDDGFLYDNRTSVQIVQNVDYLPYGELNSGNSGYTSHMFTGDERDAETDLDHTWFRQYSNAQARWLTPDPAGLAAVDPSNPQSWNRYTYVLDDPLALIDPFGLDSCVVLNNNGGATVIDTSAGDCASLGGIYNSGQDGPGTVHVDAGGPLGGIGGGGPGSGLGGPGSDANSPTGLPLLYRGGRGSGGGQFYYPPMQAQQFGRTVANGLLTGTVTGIGSKAKWYLCGKSPLDNFKNYTVEGLTKGAIVGGFAASELGPPGIVLGALGGGVEGFFLGAGTGIAATSGCSAVGAYRP